MELYNIAKLIMLFFHDYLECRGLSLSDEKTLVTHISDGFSFLGWTFRKFNGKLLIKPSKDSQKDIIERIREVLQKAKAWDQDSLIRILNPKIRGWAQYHSHAVSSKVFSKLDNEIFNLLVFWAKRRHHDKGSQWTMTKYWHKIDDRTYVFSTDSQRLEMFSDAKIIRHKLAKLDKNPYIDRDYFEQWKIKEFYRKKSIKNSASVLN